MAKKSTETSGTQDAQSLPAAKESKFQKRAAEIFKDYPNCKEVSFTSDGYAFFEASDAQNHARSLKEKEIETIKK